MHRASSWFRRPLPWVVFLLLLLGAGVFAWRAQGPRVSVATVVRDDLEQHLVASGRVMPPARIELSAVNPGLITGVFASEGDTVSAGQVLVQLDDSEAQAELAQAEARVDEARARAQQVGGVASVVASRTLEQAQATYENAVQEYERTAKLVETGALPRDDRDAQKRALDVARAQLGAAQAEQRAAGQSGVNVRASNAALAQALAQLSLAKLRVRQTRVVSPQAAIVLSREVEPGNVVSPSQRLLTLAAVGPTRLVVQPDERDLALIQLGLSARASADAFPDDVFDAEVSYIAPVVDRERGTVDVRLRVPKPPAYLRTDMSVSVDLTVGKRSEVVVIPSEAVRGLSTPRPWALVVSAGRAERRELSLGLRGIGSVEVREGVRPGEQIIVPDGQLIKAGERVRAVPREQ